MRRIVLALVVLGCSSPDPASDAATIDGGTAIDAARPTPDTSVDAPASDTGVDASVPIDAPLAADGGTTLGACVCDRTIARGDGNVDLSTLAAGSTVCLTAANSPYGPLNISNIHGTDAAPIVIRNCDGPVQIVSTTSSFAMTLNGSHFRVTGAGAAGTELGIALTAHTAAVVVALGHADHYELDHLEVSDSAYAGIMAKVDPGTANCMQFDRRYDTFVMDGVSIHDAFIHDLPAGEGIYLGDSFYTGTNNQFCGMTAGCDLAPCGGYQYPHVVRHVRIFGVHTQRTGREGIQVGAADTDCEIRDNHVETFSLAGLSSQNYGIQVGLGSVCNVESNLVEGGQIGMNIQGIGGSLVANNVIRDVDSGMQVNPRPTPLATDVVNQTYVGGFRILNNTIVLRTTSSMVAFDDINPGNAVPTSGNLIEGNLVIGGAVMPLHLTARYAWTNMANLRLDGATTLDASFCPPAASGATDASPDLTSAGVVGDYAGTSRPRGAGWDIGAVECH